MVKKGKTKYKEGKYDNLVIFAKLKIIPAIVVALILTVKLLWTQINAFWKWISSWCDGLGVAIGLSTLILAIDNIIVIKGMGPTEKSRILEGRPLPSTIALELFLIGIASAPLLIWYSFSTSLFDASMNLHLLSLFAILVAAFSVSAQLFIFGAFMNGDI